ncbi:Mur ligase family protein [Natranaerofaba carboxydovora]|uniref:Mur ligase family protein n=1 Tax=Natranaerofaba carboxydovora TaxID=2742683 RepID=UPI001F12AF3B|nr:UDP-N-acetylmuramoyl-L-alanyl-D-glutamate--2,6-diaminopimelate ligase [Natranaerofaba carboxydovora]UMZ75244.1 UDP-N-acetylmuramoyl-L-alanyl-D-glutamate--2,6-diaminopimelate ligase [Natranaerofaba carboxydovora]
MSYKNSLAKTPTSITSLLKTLGPDIDEIGDLDKEVTITGITNDSRKVKNGDLFVAYKGINEDGHKYINQAIENGAKAIITEKQKNELKDSQVPYLKVKDGRKALAKASAALYEYPSNKMFVTGITGTNGKTSSTFLIDYLLNCDNKSSGLLGTVYNKFKDKKVNSSLTTPTAPELQESLYNMYKDNIDYVTMEVSSHSLKEKRVNEIDFDIAGITNFSVDHLDYHPNYRDYFLSKANLFKLLKPDSYAIFNVDDPIVLEFCNRTRANIITYSLDYDHSMIKISNLKLLNQKSEFDLQINEEIPTLNNEIISPGKTPISIPLPGKHNVYNAALAIICSALLGVKLEDIANYLPEFKGLFRRFQVVHKNNFTVIDDFAHNPASIKAVINTVKQLPFNSLILVFGVRGGRGVKINLQNAKTLSQELKDIPLKELIITKYKDLEEQQNSISKAEFDTFYNSLNRTNDTNLNINVKEELKPALKKAVRLANKNDIILLIGGHGMDSAQTILKEII